MRNIAKVLVFISCFSWSCSKKDNINSIKQSYFVLNQVLLKTEKISSNLSSNGDPQNTFNLGDIKKSNTFYFSLSNGGNTPIFDVTLNFSNSNFTIYPSYISILDINSNLSIASIIKVGVLHGLQIDELGYAPLLSQGINENVLTIKGKTISGKDTITISSDYTMNVNALVMDVEIYNGATNMDFSKYTTCGSVLYKDSCKNSGLSQLKIFDYTSGITMKNTGNVTIDVAIFDRQDNPPMPQPSFAKSFVLKKGETSEIINLPLCAGLTYGIIYGVRIKCNGVVSDINKFDTGNDGVCYFALGTSCK